ncbi:MAG: D-glycero-beta-D-manno-heptose 1-phosphate adenylyltransferase [Candidatus Omnitrophica bacterium]|nr:D-glycero-beta-D-manno-heptose 1-phosphate adenylyltransferase [Candidatus Omnitrophota bacterium]MCB9747696.1 D-glycero-beta-D-manno-heptose 1-phosphate adenylyltransferase [Candidatus Omnitrophota bacterium]
MNTRTKIVTLTTLKRKLTQLRKEGEKIAFTNGCFDILHYGHVSYLEAAKKKSRILIVGLNSDSSIRRIKGADRPILPQVQRAVVLAALACIDFVIIFNEDTPLKLIKALKPDVLIKGADWKNKGIVGEDVVLDNGGKIEYIKYIPNASTTNVIERIQKKCRKM